MPLLQDGSGAESDTLPPEAGAGSETAQSAGELAGVWGCFHRRPPCGHSRHAIQKLIMNTPNWGKWMMSPFLRSCEGLVSRGSSDVQARTSIPESLL